MIADEDYGTAGKSPEISLMRRLPRIRKARVVEVIEAATRSITATPRPGLIGICLGIRRRQILLGFLAAYLLVELIWPWPPPRFVIPVLVFLAGYSLNEMWNLGSRYRFRSRNAALLGICGMLVFGNVWQTYQVSRSNRDTHYPSMLASSSSPVTWGAVSGHVCLDKSQYRSGRRDCKPA